MVLNQDRKSKISNTRKNLKNFWQDITNQVSRQIGGSIFNICDSFVMNNNIKASCKLIIKISSLVEK